MIRSLIDWVKNNKRKVITWGLAYVIYTFSQMEVYDIVGMTVHTVLNIAIFIFVAKAVVAYAEKYVAGKRKSA